MPSNKPKLMTYTDETTIKKFKFIANKDNRSMSKELEFIVKNLIENYEKEHGTIELPEPPKKIRI